MIETITRFTCPCCGNITIFEPEHGIEIEDSGSVHDVDLGVVGYGSEYQNLRVKFNVCDKCLVSWLESFEIKPDFIVKDEALHERMLKAYGQCD